jgi:hypothetical protein
MNPNEDILLKLIAHKLKGDTSIILSEEEVLSLLDQIKELQEQVDHLNDQLVEKVMKECEHGFYDCDFCSEGHSSFVHME